MSKCAWVVMVLCVFVLGLGRAGPGLASSVDTLDSQDLLSEIADSQGKVVVVNFWATWCQACQEEIVVLKRLRDAYSHENVRVLGILIDQDIETLNDYDQKGSFNFPLFIAASDIVHEFNIHAFPKTYVFDHQGQLVHKEFGLVSQNRLQTIIDNILKKL
jgi:thiol-disulfide isomerase/thioredoxin